MVGWRVVPMVDRRAVLLAVQRVGLLTVPMVYQRGDLMVGWRAVQLAVQRVSLTVGQRAVQMAGLTVCLLTV